MTLMQRISSGLDERNEACACTKSYEGHESEEMAAASDGASYGTDRAASQTSLLTVCIEQRM
jgi:hypothetical protein